MSVTHIYLSWEDFKAALVKTRIPHQYRETANAFELSMRDIGTHWNTNVYKDNDPNYDETIYNDFITNYKSTANKSYQPRTEDGRVITQPVTLDSGWWHWFCGAGDSGGNLATGTQFTASASTTTPVTKTWSFRDVVTLAGGVGHFRDGRPGDFCDFRLYAPATPVVANGSNTGNVNLYTFLGIPSAIILPAAGNGTHDIDLADVHPVPATANNGYWNYARNAIGKGTVSVSATPGQAFYHLFAIRMDLVRFIAKAPILGNGQLNFDPSNVKPTDILPEWEFECILTNSNGDHTVDLSWILYAARQYTTM